MTRESLHNDFLALWKRAQNHPSIGDLTPSLVESWAIARGVDVVAVEERDVGVFAPTRSIVLTSHEGRACFPKIATRGDSNWELNHRNAISKASLWEKMEWFEPLWIPTGSTQQLLTDAAHCSKEDAINQFDYHTSTLYTLAFQAVCIAQLLPRARSLVDFSPLAREAYLAFYSGYRASSIAGLIPVIEGALTRIVAGAGAGGDLPIPEKVDRTIRGAIERAARLHFEEMWVPREYLTTEYLFGQDERVFVFETFRRWLLRSFFRKSGEYDGATWLNRHVFAHGASVSWQQSANFARLIVALATLGLVESWHDESDQISLMFPDMNDDSTLLWQQAQFHLGTQGILKRLEERRYHERGRLVPELPTDDGVLLRKAILSEDCINDLVRPLRDAGWNVHVDEPDEQALYVEVKATKDNEKYNVALLYSCATANEIYRRLAENANAILYLGAPYHQEQFTRGVTIHVGPVAGWQPPLAPGR